MSDRLICLGNVIIDIAMAVPALPERGGDVVATRSDIIPGGAFNVLVAATRQGLACAYAGGHGTGPFGDRVRAALRREGIAALLDPIPDADTGHDIALTDSDGERTFITAIGAEASLTTERLAPVRADGTDLVYVSGYGLLRDPNRTAIRCWLAEQSASVPVLLDPGPLGHHIDPVTLAAVRARADWWSCSQREALLLTGESDPLRAAAALAELMPTCGIVLRRGGDGCLLQPTGEPAQQVDGFAVTVIDTNGAGDAHTGGFLAALANGHEPLEAARRANAGAALAITRPGPATAPMLSAVDAMLR